jgi:excisionase family DNA binding protein
VIQVKDAAEVLGVSQATVRRRIHTGEIRADRVGTQFVITDPKVQAAIKRLRRQQEAVKPPNVSDKVAVRGQALFNEKAHELLAGGREVQAWLYVVRSPKPHLVSMAIVDAKSMVSCDCEWMASLHGRNARELRELSQICAHIYCCYQAVKGGE